MGRLQRTGSRVYVDFSSLLCESQGMVTINILYSLKPSKNTILEREGWWRARGGGGGGGLRSLPRRSSSVYTSRAVLCLVPLIFTYL